MKKFKKVVMPFVMAGMMVLGATNIAYSNSNITE